VDTLHSLKKDWVLTPEAFELLLARLDSDRDLAAQKYEDIRRKLILFFESRGCLIPEESADETFNRVARKLSEGVEVRATDPASYCYGIARNVLQEYWAEPSRSRASMEDVTRTGRHAEHPDQMTEKRLKREKLELRIECLQRCIAGLPENHQALIVRYYEGDSGAKVRGRKLLAEQLGIPINALRIRALRIREKLEDCVNGCFNESLAGA
jgi:DNA-directed RNA polymerase specialized sigma24 family protein